MNHDPVRRDPLPTPGEGRVPAPPSAGPRPAAPVGPAGWIPLLGAAIPVAVFLLGWLEHRLAPPAASAAAPAPSLRPAAAPGTGPARAERGAAQPPRAPGTAGAPARP